MIPLNVYQKARLDVLKVFYRYHTMSDSELKESSFQNDMETIFKKWGNVVEVKDAKKILKDECKKNKNSSEILLYEPYRDCIDDMLHSLTIGDRLQRTEHNLEFCKTIKKAQDRYHKKSHVKTF